MTPRAMRAQARVLGAALLLAIAIASSDTRAGDLYRWVTQDGRVEIGATPPPGTEAVPWNPGQEALSPPTALPAATPAPAPAVTPPAATPAPATARSAAANGRARSLLEEECSTGRATADRATQKIRILESQIARLERRLEELQATDLAYSQTSCRSQGIEGPSTDCLTSSFHRDTEIARTQAEIEEAQEKLADLEQRVRGAAAPAECAPASPE